MGQIDAPGVPVNRDTIFTLTELDLRRAVRLHVFSSIREPRIVLRLSILWIVAMAGFVAFFAASGMPWDELRDSLPIFALVITATILGVDIGLPLVLSALVIRRRFQEEKLLQRPVSASWDEAAYEVEQPGVHNRIPWRDYTKLREDRHLFVFFVSNYNYQVLPKRALTEDQVRDIQRILVAGRDGNSET